MDARSKHTRKMEMVKEVMAAATAKTIATTTVTTDFTKEKRKPPKEMRFSRFHISRKSSSSRLPSVTNENGARERTRNSVAFLLLRHL